MIEVSRITKHLGDKCVLDRVSMSFEEGRISVIRGPVGSGKSTLFRIIAGIIRPDDGVVIVDDMPIYDNRITKERIFAVIDRPYFPESTVRKLCRFYSGFYSGFDAGRADELCARYGIDPGAGLRRLPADKRSLVPFILGAASGARYLLCDGIFDEMSEQERKTASELLVSERDEKGLTVILSVSDDDSFRDTADREYSIETDK